MGAQLFGSNPYSNMSGLATKHGGVGNGQLFDQQTAPAQYQQSLNAQGQAAGGIGQIMQLLAYMHKRHSGQSGNPAEGNPGLNQSSFPAPMPGQQPLAGANQALGTNFDRGGPADRVQSAGLPSMMHGTGTDNPASFSAGVGTHQIPPFVQLLMHLYQPSQSGQQSMNPLAQIPGSNTNNYLQGG